jgi:hypothetical protein
VFQWISNDKPAPEALELEAKLQQLEALEERYAEVQTEHITLQNALAAFKQRYWKRVGNLYAQLDSLRAEIARLRARLSPRDQMRQAAVGVASSQARASADAARDFETSVDCEPFAPTEDLRKFYRMAARIVHPDRANDDEDRKLRDEIMSRINVAYRDGHVHTIQTLIDEYQMRATPGEDDAATRLIRTIRLISRVREQIADISQATGTLRESGLYRLFKVVEEAEARGEDRLRVIEAGIERDIARADHEVKRLTQEIAERYPVLVHSAATPAQEQEEIPFAGVPEGASPEAPVEAAEAQTSQVEVEISVLLREMGVDYARRQALDGIEPAPAFTLRDREGQLIVWEHQPVTPDEVQRQHWQERMTWYAAHGFDVGVNLFVTRDEADGSINLERLQRVAEFVKTLAGASAAVEANAAPTVS